MLALAPPLTHTHSTPALTTSRRPTTSRKQGSFVTTTANSSNAAPSASTSSSAALAPSISRAPSSSSHHPSARTASLGSLPHQPAPIASTSPYHTTRPKPEPAAESVPAPANHLHQAQLPPVEPALDIHTYHSQDLLRLLASLLTQIATTNDNLPPSHSPSARPSFPPAKPGEHPPIWHTLTTASRNSLSTPATSMAFHARNIPTISLEAYLLRILKYCPTTNEVFLSLLVYFDRMSKLVGESTGRTFVIDSYNVHRLVIAGVTVASKFFSDVFYTNSRYAKVGGLPQAELNQLELQFLLLNDFRLTVSPQEMQRYGEQLIRFSQHQTDAPPQATATSPAKPANHLVSSTVPRGPSSAALPRATPPPRGGAAGSASAAPPQQQHAASAYADYAGGPRAMGAIDAYGGALPADEVEGGSGGGVHRTPDGRARPPLSSASSYVTAPETDASDAASEYAETEGGETDDEPTIRAGRSVAGSEAASDAGSVMWRDDDDDDDDDGEMSSS